MDELMGFLNNLKENVQAFRVSEADAVVAFSPEEARTWYQEETGLEDDDLYTIEEIEIVPYETVVRSEDDENDTATVEEIIDSEWNGTPFIVASWEV